LRPGSLISTNFPVLELRQHPGMTSKRGRIGTNDPAEKPGSRRIPCIFPVDQRIGSRDEFAPDCLHRHSVCGSRRLPVCIEGSAENFPRFRGPWPFRVGGSEPETVGSGLGRRLGPCFSLLPSWAVRFRFRFASAKGGAQQIYQRPDGSRTVHDRAAQNESVARNWAGESSASGR
jgi:hypothetical protein